MSTLQIADEYFDEARSSFEGRELSKAAGLIHNAVVMYKKAGSYEKMANALNFMGITYSAMGDVGMAIDCYMEAIDIAVERGYDDILLLVNNNIGSIYQDLGKYEKAIKYFENAMQYNRFPDHGDRDKYYNRMLLLNLNLCISYTGINDFDMAENYLNEALTYSEILNSDDTKFFIDISQAHLLFKTGNDEEVRAHIDELVEGAIKHISMADYILEILSLCNLFMDMGEFDAWKKIIVAYEQFANEVENIFFKKVCVEMWMKYERAIGDMEAYDKLCVHYVNLSTLQESEHVERLSDTIDLKLKLQEKEVQRRKAVKLNYTDMLTGMGNKYKMHNDFEKVVEKRADKGGFTVGIVDIDFFKSFNKNSGLTTGDEAIKAVSEAINSSIGELGKGYHFYGDEFYIILQETDSSKIDDIAKNINSLVEERKIVHPASKLGKYLTISQAFVINRDVRVPDEFANVFKSVDKTLQDIKEKGRNAYVVVDAAEIGE